MVANGPLSALPQMENELAWLILINNGFEKSFTREKFQERTRRIPNQAYAFYVRSLETPNDSDQLLLLQNAVQIYRDFPEAQFRLGRAYFHKGDCGSAMPHLGLGRSERNPSVEIDFMRGTCYLQTDQPLQAVQSFYHLLQTARPYEALNNIGVAYIRKGDMALAATSLVEARSQARSDPTVSLNLALVRHLQGNESAARTLLEEASRTHPDQGMLQFLLSMVLKTEGENEKAAAAAGKARSLGIHLEKIQAEDPIKWSRALSNFENR
jgi:Flp pilus assembly protein TadD